jgi:hypothetical protein
LDSFPWHYSLTSQSAPMILLEPARSTIGSRELSAANDSPTLGDTGSRSALPRPIGRQLRRFIEELLCWARRTRGQSAPATGHLTLMPLMPATTTATRSPRIASRRTRGRIAGCALDAAGARRSGGPYALTAHSTPAHRRVSKAAPHTRRAAALMENGEITKYRAFGRPDGIRRPRGWLSYVGTRLVSSRWRNASRQS